ncbi:hypothetical protein HII12_001885 [Brettanomyces bruxellensis]|uniref:Uncharacterized protein n=1 Tax=Dekkera bruxellensis TaxID=5007 RepID=A0A8H6BK31_DEKBR|nr:hypothetical protein HII12_001885 [Brettanomyces bruxellensis]
MAKQSKKQKKTRVQKAPVGIPKKEHQQRITYMFKVGSLMAAKLKPQVENNLGTFDVLSRSYLRNMELLSKKAVLKLHPNVKRTICKECHRFLLPGLTCKLRLKNYSKAKKDECDILEVSCTCGSVKRYPIGRDEGYKLFSERADILFDPGTGPSDKP